MKALHVDPGDVIPIWKQIEDGVRRLVASGELPPEGPVASVRELAKTLRVNPATVARAYQRLTDAGLLVVRRGEGTFVAAAPPAMRAAERSRELDAVAARFAMVAASLGATQDEAEQSLDRVWSRMKRGAGAGGKR